MGSFGSYQRLLHQSLYGRQIGFTNELGTSHIPQAYYEGWLKTLQLQYTILSSTDEVGEGAAIEYLIVNTLVRID